LTVKSVVTLSNEVSQPVNIFLSISSGIGAVAFAPSSIV